MSPVHLLVVLSTLAAPRADLASSLPDQPPAFAQQAAPAGASLIEPLPSLVPEAETEFPGALLSATNGPTLVVTETPESEWLATWQSTYQHLLGDDGLALAGFYDPFSLQFAYGMDGVQPYRLGWYSYNDFILMSNSPTSVGGNFRDLQWNAWVRHARQIGNSAVLSWTGWGNGKFWAGPTGINLPPAAVQLISDFQLASAYSGPWNWQLAVAPQLNGSLEGQLNANALMADARAVLLYRMSPQWLVAFGAAYWNRATDRLIPYGGVVWAPDNRWEIRAMFPKSRASYYLGRLRGADTWLYASGEYNVEAYQVDFDGPRVSTRGEVSDYRILIGASATAGIWTMFLEGGVVTDRHFRFRGEAPDFVMDDCALLRTGLLF